MAYTHRAIKIARRRRLLLEAGAASSNIDPDSFANVFMVTDWEENTGSNFTDYSDNNITLTRENGTNLETTITKFGSQSIDFTTVNNSFVSLIGTNTGGANPFSVGTNVPFSMEAWVYFDAVPSVQGSVATIFGQYRNSLNNRAFLFDVLTSDLPRFYWSNNGSATVQNITAEAGNTVSAETWHHLAVCRDSSNNVRMFLDGAVITAETPVQDGTLIYGTTAEEVKIGAIYANGYTNEINGKIDDCRIIIGEGIYTEAFTVPDSPFAQS